MQPILLKELIIISPVNLAISVGEPGSNVSLLNRRLPASRTTTSKPSDLNSSITEAFRARPPRGFFFQPQGSVSPCTFAVLTILICLRSLAKTMHICKKENVKKKKMFVILLFIIFFCFIFTNKCHS